MKKGMKFGLSGSGAGFESCRPEQWPALAKWAEKLGYHSLWLNEEHFQAPKTLTGTTRAVLSPLIVASAMVARTRTIRLGFSVLLLPLHQPVRLAEELASLDRLSKGRIDFGVSRANKQLYLDAFGMSRDTSHAQFAQMLQTVLDCWKDDPITLNDTLLDVQPKPVQKPHPPIYLGTYSEDMAIRAAQAGQRIIIHGIQSPEHAARTLQWFVNAGGDPGHVPFGRFAYVGESDAQAQDDVMPAIQALTAFMRKAGLDKKGLISEADLQPERYLERMVIAGSAQTCVQRIAALRDELGIRHLNLLPGFFGYLPPRLLRTSLQRFAHDVMPSLR